MTEPFRKNIRKVYLFKFFMCLHFIGGVLIPFFTVWGGITFTQIMILQAWFMLCIFLLEIPTGTIADYFGRKNTIILASAVNTIAVFVYSSIPVFYIFFLGEFLWALSEALLSGAGEAFIYDTLKEIGETEKSKQIFGRYESFGLLGYMVAAPIGSIVAVFFGVRTPFVIMAIPFFTAAILGLTFKEPKFSEEHEKKKGFVEIIREGLRIFYNSRVLKVLALEMVSIGTISFLMIWIYQPILLELHINIGYFGIVHSAWLVGEIIVMNSYNKFEKVLGSKRRYIRFSSFLIGSMYLIGGLVLSIKLIPMVLIAIFLIISFGLTRTPLLISYMNKHIPSPQRATVLSTINMFQKLSLVIMYPLTGLLVEWSLVYTTVIFGIIVLVFAISSRVKEEYLVD